MGISEEGGVECLTTGELSLKFAESRGQDHASGEELMRRVVRLSGLEPVEVWLEKPLKDRERGAIIDASGNNIRVKDYLCDVAPRHPGAIRGVLDFLNAGPSRPNFEAEQRAMAGMIEDRTL